MKAIEGYDAIAENRRIKAIMNARYEADPVEFFRRIEESGMKARLRRAERAKALAEAQAQAQKETKTPTNDQQ